MLKVFYGSDTEVVRAAAFADVQTYTSNGYELQRIDALNYETGKLADVCEGVSLFGTPSVYLFDTPSAQTDFWAELVALQETLMQATEPYIVIEGQLTATEKKQLVTQIEWQEAKATPTKRFDTFRLADALVRGDKRSLWITLQEARAAGVATEELIGILWWQVKLIRLAQITNSAQEAKVKDYPYRKAQQAAKRYSKEQALHLVHSLLAVYHDGHGGERDIDIALEQWVLSEV